MDELSSTDTFETMLGGTHRSLRTIIVGGGKGCESILRMNHEDKLGRFIMEIVGIAELDLDTPGVRYAREIGLQQVTTDYHELFEIPDLDLLIELTGNVDVRDEIERNRPRHIAMIDHVGARLFWQLHKAEEKISYQRTEMRERVESERRKIAQIFDSIPAEIVVVDTEMRVQSANRAFLTNNQQQIGDIHSCHCYDVDSEIRGECQVAVGNCPFFQVMKDKQIHAMVRKHFDADGNARYANIVGGPMIDDDGEVVGMVEMTRDITHRIRTEEALKETEGQLQQLLEHAPMAAFVKNRQGQYVEVNPAACQLLGKEQAEIIGKTDLELFPREVASLLVAGDRHVINKGIEITTELEVELHYHKRSLSTVKFPIRNTEGKVSAVSGISKDVTEQREAEAELDRTREYLQNVLRYSPLAVITTDMQGHVVSFNRGAEVMFGYTADEVIGQPASVFYREPEERAALARRLFRGDRVRDYHTDLLHQDGQLVPVAVTMAVLRDSAGEPIGTVGMSKDVSHRKALMDQILQSERLAAVGRLAAGVAHEINNPLAVIGEISGYTLDLLEDEDEDPEELIAELRNWLPKIADQVKRTRNITRRMLSFARKSEVEVHIVDINKALGECVPFLEKEAILAGVTIHEEYPPDLPEVQAEEMQLEEIAINLLKNAIQAMREVGGGNVWLSTGFDGNKVYFTVRDDGPGIAEEVRDRLFDPFVTTKPPGKGTGLGLSICYGIVKRYDGEIRVDSAVGEGTTFTVIFPPHRSKGERAAEAAEDEKLSADS
jgi:PAS domain S-box-containing protein